MAEGQKREKKAHLQPLDKDQVDYAWELIDEIHPIAQTPLYVVYPALRPFRKILGCIPQMNYEEQNDSARSVEMDDLLAGEEKTVTINGRQVIKKKKDKKKKPQQAATDPLAQLGYGITAYIGILWTIFGLFAFFSLLLIPTMRAF